MNQEEYGPKNAFSEDLHAIKYRTQGESFHEAMCRIAAELSDTEDERQAYKDILLNMRFLPAGRVQAAVGAAREVTPFNCYVSRTIEDDSHSIMDALKESFLTMRMGGGIGYDFSNLRPKGFPIASLEAESSGPLSFMDTFDANCQTVMSAGHRRGAQMAVLRVDHPDIEEFIHAKQNEHRLRNFNISVGVTDKFMVALQNDEQFALEFEGKAVKWVSARKLWDEIMRSTWEWAEPGVLFIDRINDLNNLYYTETIAATNPCGEQPLPPYGACLLGSFNLTQYVKQEGNTFYFDYEAFEADIPHIVRMIDNVIDDAIFPLPEQKEEAINKRRMGLGVTGLANAAEALGFLYGSPIMVEFTRRVLETLRNTSYMASVDLAKEKGPFPLFDREKYIDGKFVQGLPREIKKAIYEHGIRNSHLTSIAPCGTISLTADNVSSGLEPVFSLEIARTVNLPTGTVEVTLKDYAYETWGVHGKVSANVTTQEHIEVLKAAVPYIDSAISKTCNVGDEVSWEEFKDIYMQAWQSGAKGCTTFRPAGKRFGILNTTPEEEASQQEVQDTGTEGAACFIDPSTGIKSCE